MGILNFLKKFRKSEVLEEIIIKQLTFSDIQSWVNKKIKEKELQEKEIINEIQEKIGNFIKNLQEKIETLRNFDLDTKEVRDQVKGIVNDSRELYIKETEDLILNLEKLEESNLEKYLERINKIFQGFNKKSFKNYEKTRILIGDEIVGIKEILKELSKNLSKIFEESLKLINSIKILKEIKEKSDVITESDKKLNDFNKEKLELNRKIKEQEREEEFLLKNLEEIKLSKDYLENLDKQKKIKFLKEKLKDEILNLKHLIDFKALANFFHINPQQMKLLKDYQENFSLYFEKDFGETIISLLKEAKLEVNVILNKIKEIKKQKDEIINLEKGLNDDDTKEINKKINKICIDLENLKEEIHKKEKQRIKLNIHKEEILDVLKQKLEKENIQLIKK